MSPTAPRPDVLLERLTSAPGRKDRLTHVEHIPARKATHTAWPQWADADVVGGYSAMGVNEPWLHQVHAAEAVHSGRHTVLATSTGSGKSLAFWLPAISQIRASERPRPTVMYLCPTKALAADQLTSLEKLLALSGISNVRATTVDGDTTFEERRWAQEHADIILTNPDLLHFSLLPRHSRWTRVLRNLSIVVIDESHSYKGVFGAHVAAVLRRLRRICAHYGATPTFVLASATSAAPAASAARLIGVLPDDVVAVTEDTSPSGRRTVALWEPPLIPAPASVGAAAGSVVGSESRSAAGSVAPPTVSSVGGVERIEAGGAFEASPWDTDVDGATSEDDALAGTFAPMPEVRRAATAETADLLADLVSMGARSLAFVRSRRSAETVANTTRRHLEHVSSELPQLVASYRGGYLAEERRALEKAIRSGELRALATTNALELGMDISGLDAVLIAGWPGTRASLWQQAGRAGRSGKDGLAVLIARDDPLDTYLVHHPEAIFDSPVEATVFDPENPYVLAPHLCAAAAEKPLTGKDLELFGPGTRELLDVLTARGALRHRASGWYWTSSESPTDLTDLRGAGGYAVRVVEEETGRMLGTVDAASATGTVHPGAVYLHQGSSYRVQMLDLDDGVALVTPHRDDYSTYSLDTTQIMLVGERRSKSWSHGVQWHFGVVDVTEQVTSYQRRLPDGSIVATVPLDMPEQSLRTAAAWWTVTPELIARAAIEQADLPGALHAAEHASIGILPLIATCDRWDLGGVSIALHPDTELPTVFVYDGYPGGAGFAERGYEMAREWLTAARDVIAACGCHTGCPSCVQSPKCGNGNEPLDKAGALRLLNVLLAEGEGSATMDDAAPVRTPQPGD